MIDGTNSNVTCGKILNKDRAFQKIKYYCSYQERCHREVKEKLYGFGLRKVEVEELVSELIQADYLNEERFAIQYAGGKFRIKNWGRIKIQHELLQKGVSSYCVKKGLKEIDEQEYSAILKKLATVKWTSLKKDNAISKQAKLYAYLLRKGYEAELIGEVLDTLKTAIRSS